MGESESNILSKEIRAEALMYQMSSDDISDVMLDESSPLSDSSMHTFCMFIRSIGCKTQNVNDKLLVSVRESVLPDFLSLFLGWIERAR